MIPLKESDPLAKGRSRLVFQHPDKHDLLIKVMLPDSIEERFGSGTKWYKKRRRYGHLLSYAREIQEYLVTRADSDHAPDFLQIIIGFVETDLGLGLVAKAVRTPEGNLATTLAALIFTGKFDAQKKADLATALDQILECNIIVSDLNLGNFVHDGERFVLIDGMGNSNPCPSKS